jgi:hypothetical protein
LRVKSTHKKYKSRKQASEMQPFTLNINGQPITIEPPPQRRERQRQERPERVRTPPRNHRPPRREEVNRFYTATSVEYSVDGTIRELKWFTDIQMAYLWILNKTKNISYDTYDTQWDIRTFEETADRLEERWYDGKDGLVVAKMEEHKFRVFYNPEENESIRRNQRQVSNP